MDRAQVSRVAKGIHVRWYKNSSKVFPNYRDISGSVVGIRRLNRAKIVVQKILTTQQPIITREFVALAKKKGGTVSNIDFSEALEKVQTAKMGSIISPDESYYGCTKNSTIWITAMKMSDELLIGTLLHEAIHDICTIGGKYICEVDEHHVMRTLGDNC